MVARILEEDKGILLDLQQMQMYAGRDSRGSLITPGYLDDPFFKSSETAQKYARWKSRLPERRDRSKAESIFGAKPVDTPDLIITGTLVYDSLIVRVTNDALAIEFSGRGQDINQGKYGGRLDGLSPEAWRWYKQEHFTGKLTERLKEHMGLW